MSEMFTTLQCKNEDASLGRNMGKMFSTDICNCAALAFHETAISIIENIEI